LIHLIKGKLPKINTSDGSCLDLEFIQWSLANKFIQWSLANKCY
jgi:hypothetical protein